MGERNLKPFRSTDTISASEIGQFQFCSNAWYLQKCGYEPDSIFMKKGSEKHKNLGKTIDRYEGNLKKSNIFKFAGFVLLLLTILVLLIGVIL